MGTHGSFGLRFDTDIHDQLSGLYIPSPGAHHKMLIALDTETTGVPLWSYPDPFCPKQVVAWPRLVSVAWQVVTPGVTPAPEELVARPDGFVIPTGASNVHGISTARATEVGKPLVTILDRLLQVLNTCQDDDEVVVIAAYNYEFDYGVLVAECTRLGHPLGARLGTVQWQCVMRLVKQAGNHDRYLNLKRAVELYAPNHHSSRFHSASGDVTALVALMLARALTHGQRRRHQERRGVSAVG